MQLLLLIAPSGKNNMLDMLVGHVPCGPYHMSPAQSSFSIPSQLTGTVSGVLVVGMVTSGRVAVGVVVL